MMGNYVKKEPNFIIAGGVASGTSFLSNVIKDHPEIYLPRVMRPECNFFYKSWELNKGKQYYLDKWFHEVEAGHKAVGERSSLYLHGKYNSVNRDVARNIHGLFPDMKIIFCLRNPTERAYANYRFTALSGFETWPFRKAVEMEEQRSRNERGMMKEIQPHIYRSRGCYIDQLESFYELFPEDQILCLKSETLSRNTAEELKRVYRFLGVDENFVNEENENFSSPNVKNLKLQALYRRILGRKFDVVTENFRVMEAESFWVRLVARNLTKDKQPMSDADREYLNDFYRPYNARLAKFLNWDLSDWS